MDAPVERPLGEAAIRSGEHVLAPDELAVADDALGGELGMFHHIGGVTDDARDQCLALRQLHLLPHLPFVRVTRIGAFDHVGPDLHLEDEVDDVLERHVGGVRSGPASPTDVIPHAIGGQPFDRLIEHLHVQGQPFAVIGEACRRHHAIVAHGGTRAAARSRHRRSFCIPCASP